MSELILRWQRLARQQEREDKTVRGLTSELETDTYYQHSKLRREFVGKNDGPFNTEADRLDELADLSFLALQRKLL